ncbi:MAG: DUF2393 family protein [Sulfurimonadaceae bacterium]|jgi:hypothetical protein|nr:DUF2393 family protein [Sulfurimonadaceae bacterium]
MKEKITTIVENIIMYDYLLFGGAFFLFILFIIFALLARRRAWISTLLITIAFAVILTAPTMGYEYMHTSLFKNEIIITSEKKLLYSQAVIVEGELKNISEHDFKHCDISAKIFQASSNEFKNYIYSFIPFRTEKVRKEQIAKEKSKKFTIIIEPFVYEGFYKIEVEGRCR